MFLWVAGGLCFFVGLLSEIDESVDEAYVYFFEQLAVVEEDEAVEQAHRTTHA